MTDVQSSKPAFKSSQTPHSSRYLLIFPFILLAIKLMDIHGDSQAIHEFDKKS